MPLEFKFVEQKVKRARSINYIILIQGVSKYENICNRRYPPGI